MAITDAADLLQEFRGRRHVAALTLDGLEKNRGAFFWGDSRLEDFVFDETRAIDGVLLRFSPGGPAIAVRIGHVRHATCKRHESATLLRLARGQRKRAHCASVKRVVERDHMRTLSVISRE